MIYVNLTGGLGNQMFQFAAAKNLAIKYKTDVSLSLKWFNEINASVTSRDFELPNVVNSSEYKIIESDKINFIEKNNKNIFDRLRLKINDFKLYFETNGYNSEFEKLGLNTYLKGYFQDFRYFESNLDKVLNSFVLDKNISSKTIEFSRHIKSEKFPVAMHVRRGDYANHNRTNQIHGLLDEEYYHRALDQLINLGATKVFIFSDDIKWVEQNHTLNLPGAFVDFNLGNKSYEDMYLMSICKGHIIANSTFSWWGATLSKSKNKIMIGPKKWFADSTRLVPNIFNKEWTLL